jgi:hypothetical protein
LFSTPPDADWSEGVADVYETTTAVVQAAVARWFAASTIRPPTSPRGFDAVLDALRRAGHHLKPHRDSHSRLSFRTTCPAHADARPSFVVTREDDGRALLHCFAGCRKHALVDALGLRMADLFTSSVRRSPRQVEAVYDYRAFDGRLLGQKVRYRPKGFRWRRHEDEVSVYRLPDLIDTPMVFLTEGEKAVDRLWARGLPATCGPNGAGRWTEAWSRDLWTAGCRELVVLPDHDAAGHQHAERVAAITAPLGITVKVLHLPGLASKADVADWLDAGGTDDVLERLARDAPIWSPGWRDDARRQRRLALTRERVRRWRERERNIRCVTEPHVAAPETNIRRVTSPASEHTTRYRPSDVTRNAVTPANVPLSTLRNDSVEDASSLQRTGVSLYREAVPCEDADDDDD